MYLPIKPELFISVGLSASGNLDKIMITLP